MSGKTILRGITWNHTRGFLPLVATAQRFTELHSGLEIIWEKRSLQEFADAPISGLIEKYDLLVIDHPWAGHGAANHALLPLEKYLPADFLADQKANQAGPSHDSYTFDGVQTALAIDAATPVSSWREELLNEAPPKNWDEVLTLARTGKVLFAGIPIDSLMNFYMLCVALGEAPFAQKETVISRETGRRVLQYLRELAALCPPWIFSANPIAVYEALSRSDNFVYCPFAYGYSNYSRRGYSAKPLTFGDLPEFAGKLLQSTLGGTGLSISARTSHRDLAVAYVTFVASPEIQKTIYTAAGGQPGHRAAWLDAENNRTSNNYFRRTLPALTRAYLRPRYNGYLHFQDRAGEGVRAFMMGEAHADAVLEKMDALYAESLVILHPTFS